MQFRKVIYYSYAHIQPTLISSSFRNLSTSSQLFKHQQQRYREAKVTVNEKSKSRRDAARELLMKTNRTKWEREMAQLNILKGRIPTSDTYLISEFEPKKYSLSEAVELLRESAQPDMYDCMDNPVRVKNSDDREAYLTAGAYDAGGSALIQRISQGHYHWGEYDTVVAHQSWESQVTKLRHILKERLPTIKNGRFGEDMMKLMSIHSNSIQLESTSIDGVPEIGLLDIILGQLSWDFNRLEENLRSYLECIESQKSSRIINEFIQSGEIHCPPTGERFILDISQYCSLGNKSKANQLVDEGEKEEEEDDDDDDDDDDHDDTIDMMSIQIEKQQNTNELDI
ncbi:large subunit ribosomal protein L1 [Schistosoma bovis]|uniref:Large subunit ribosomal protein L1 n=1 Tax=Schistosoma bovis TaxID=6184 RepID=A0A430Q6D2_SCHBO|nr:large subunit ribosomal protein L1 [Schistosoma bovis]